MDNEDCCECPELANVLSDRFKFLLKWRLFRLGFKCFSNLADCAAITDHDGEHLTVAFRDGSARHKNG